MGCVIPTLSNVGIIPTNYVGLALALNTRNIQYIRRDKHGLKVPTMCILIWRNNPGVWLAQYSITYM